METSEKSLLKEWPVGVLILFALDLAGSFFLYPRLHGYAFIQFFETLGVYVLLFVIRPTFDPHRANYNRFSDTLRYIKFVVVLALVIVHWVLILTYIFGWHVSIERAIIITLSALFLAIGNVMGRTKQCWFFGVSNPWTLSNEKVWARTQRPSGIV